MSFEIWATYQHTDALDKTLESLGLPKPSFTFARGAKGKPIERPTQVITWLWDCFRSLLRNRKSLSQKLGSNSLIIVHGDTLTTVFGAIAAKILRTPSAHIEAGLRSGNLLRPFPEEIDRRIVGMLATVHFAPNADATRNLRNRDVVNTFRNTAVDGVLDVLGVAPSTLDPPYGLVLLHRFEFISQHELVRQTIHTLDKYSPVPLIVITDVFSGGPINEYLNELDSEKIRVIDKLPYPNFVNAMAGAEFVFTDSGGLQQEAGLLGVPTMLHRQVTESPDGVGRNVVLSEWDLTKVETFLTRYNDFRAGSDEPTRSPSEVICDWIMNFEGTFANY